MPPLFDLWPLLPLPLTDTLIYVVAGLGAVLISYAIFLETERRQDAVFTIGASCLLVYAIFTDNIIFIIAMGGLALGSFIELIEILIGRHIHTPPMVENFKDPKNK